MIITEKNGFQSARNALSDPKSSSEVICAACDVLAVSDSWADIRRVSEGRYLLFSRAGSDMPKPDMHQIPDFVQDHSYLIAILAYGVEIVIGAAAVALWWQW